MIVNNWRSITIRCHIHVTKLDPNIWIFKDQHEQIRICWDIFPISHPFFIAKNKRLEEKLRSKAWKSLKDRANGLSETGGLEGLEGLKAVYYEGRQLETILKLGWYHFLIKPFLKHPYLILETVDTIFEPDWFFGGCQCPFLVFLDVFLWTTTTKTFVVRDVWVPTDHLSLMGWATFCWSFQKH